jgi:hypothetical protein
MAFVSKTGEPLAIYVLSELDETADHIALKLCKPDNKLLVIRGKFELIELRRHDLIIDDFRNTPSFVVQSFKGHRKLQFIVGRKAAITAIKMPK